jgi:hypothetical protein
VERATEIVDIIWASCHSSPSEPKHSTDFIENARPVTKKKISLKTIALVVSTYPDLTSAIQEFLLTIEQLQALKNKAPRSAEDSIQMVQELVDTEAPIEPEIPRKRKHEEVSGKDEMFRGKVKTERSWSSGSGRSSGTSATSMSTYTSGVKMEADGNHPVDEETSKAASILNGVSMDRRQVLLISRRQRLI